VHPNDKVFASLHVAYELRQMSGAALRIDSAPDEITHFALLESTLVHARTLIEFLTGTDNRDIRAEQLCPGWQIDPTDREALRLRREGINKHLAHLSWARVTDMPARWPYPRIVREIVDHMRRYHTAMKEAGAAFDKAIADELERIDREAPRVWTSETIYTDVETSTSATVARISRTEDPLVLSDFGEDG
jgi:hypothetical protein